MSKIAVDVYLVFDESEQNVTGSIVFSNEFDTVDDFVEYVEDLGTHLRPIEGHLLDIE